MTRDQLKKLERDLWSAANKLRASSDLKASEYSTPALGLIFLKFADNKYRQHEDAIVAEYHQLQGTRRERSVEEIAIERCGFYRRPDVLLYVNGLPLVFIELKNSNVKLRAAYDDNLSNYKAEIPQLFMANALCLLSNGIETRVGSLSAEWSHFFAWLRVDDEKEVLDRAELADGTLSLERAVLGLLAPARLVDEAPKVLVQDWHKDQQTQRQVRSEIERVLDQDLPDTYERTLFKQKCDNVFDLAVDYASRGRKWAA